MLLQAALCYRVQIRRRKRRSVVSYGPCQFPTLVSLFSVNGTSTRTPQTFWKISSRIDRSNSELMAAGGGRGEEEEEQVVVRRGGRRNNERFRRFSWSLNTPRSNLGASIFSTWRQRVATVVKEGGVGKEEPSVPAQHVGDAEAYRTIRVSPEQIMKIAEELYNKGFISYPRRDGQVPARLGHTGPSETFTITPRSGFTLERCRMRTGSDSR